MPDVLAKFVKHGGRDRLHPVEQLVAVAVSNPKGTFAGGVVGMAAGGSFGAGLGATAARRGATGQGASPDGASIASRLPSKTLVLVLTDQRLACFATAGLGFTLKTGALLCEYLPREVYGIQRVSNTMTWTATLWFVDGSGRALEFQKSTSPESTFFEPLDRWVERTHG